MTTIPLSIDKIVGSGVSEPGFRLRYGSGRCFFYVRSGDEFEVPTPSEPGVFRVDSHDPDKYGSLCGGVVYCTLVRGTMPPDFKVDEQKGRELSEDFVTGYFLRTVEQRAAAGDEAMKARQRLLYEEIIAGSLRHDSFDIAADYAHRLGDQVRGELYLSYAKMRKR